MAARGNEPSAAAGQRVFASSPAHGHEKTPRTGPAASVHEANLWVGADVAPRLLTADFLGGVAAEYRRFLGRVSGGLLRTRFEPGYESLVLLFSRPSLLRFRAPVYGEGPDWAELRWSIESGLLVAAVGRGRGSLRLYLCRLPSPVDGGEELVPMLARMEVDGDYPRSWWRPARRHRCLAVRTDPGPHTHPRHAWLPRFLARIEVPPTPSDSPVIVARGNAEVGRRALVTGATGFVGRRLATALGELGWEVVCVVRDRSWAQDLANRGFELHEADVLDSRALRGAGTGCRDRLLPDPFDGGGELRATSRSESGDARNFAEMAQRDEVARVVYLGGLGDRPQSKHLRSRRQTR